MGTKELNRTWKTADLIGTISSYRDHLGIYWGYIGRMEKNMGTTIMGLP